MQKASQRILDFKSWRIENGPFKWNLYKSKQTNKTKDLKICGVTHCSKSSVQVSSFPWGSHQTLVKAKKESHSEWIVRNSHFCLNFRFFDIDLRKNLASVFTITIYTRIFKRIFFNSSILCK